MNLSAWSGTMIKVNTYANIMGICGSRESHSKVYFSVRALTYGRYILARVGARNAAVRLVKSI